ncbi:MAG: hypothetical protein ACRYG5_01600 [Janthinobacterium lividum]
MFRKLFLLPALCSCLIAGGCVSIGETQLRADQVSYERALGEAKKREMLAAIVGLRYADEPGFLTVTQIIAAYTFDATGGSTLNGGSGSEASFAQATGSVSYSNHPTFTFTPTTGQAYATAFIRPLPATLFLPLASSDVPIDLLLRLTAQSMGGLRNGSALGGPNSNGSPQFFELLRLLRSLQIAGELTVEYREDNHIGHVSITLAGTPTGDSTQTERDVERVRTLLHLSSRAKSYEVTYGQAAGSGDTITMVPRSVLGILSNLGAQISVPPGQVESGATKPTVGLVGGEARPTVVVHAGKSAPANAYASIAYGGTVYWIDNADFDSKYAFTVVQNLMALAEANQDAKTPVITVPAG